MNEHTYQDLLAVGQNETDRMAFCLKAIQAHRSSTEYRRAVIAQAWAYEKLVCIVASPHDANSRAIDAIHVCNFVGLCFVERVYAIEHAYALAYIGTFEWDLQPLANIGGM